MTENTNWYVIQVNTGSEHRMRDMITTQLAQTQVPYEDCFVPMVEYVRKINHVFETKTKPMFPGYLFLISARNGACDADKVPEESGQIPDNATDSATDNATDSATNNATDNATNNATDNATNNATINATDNSTDGTIDNIRDIVASLKDLVGFTKILGDSQNYIPLYAQEVDFLLGFSDSNHKVGLSCGVIENDQIIVTKGPLMGKEAIIKKINRHKRIAEIELLFMGRTTKVQVPLEIVTKR